MVAQHIPFWVECMFLVETLYNVVSHQMQQIEEGFEGFEGSGIDFSVNKNLLNPSSLNTVIFRILVVRLFSWSPKGDSATLGEKREKENEERRRMKERRRDGIILMKQVKSMHHT